MNMVVLPGTIVPRRYSSQFAASALHELLMALRRAHAACASRTTRPLQAQSWFERPEFAA
jgi:hypothetical protein